jgi:CheY-like chemotaxis protein
VRRRLKRILLVEDNVGDARLAVEAFKEAGVEARIDVARDGVDALAFLRRREPFADASRPDLVILDLNMPRKDGREVLIDLKQDPHLARIPVVVFTTSSAERDIHMSYQHQANCFLTKPIDFSTYCEAVQQIARFWEDVATLPPR